MIENKMLFNGTFNQFQIKLIPKYNSLLISVYKSNTYNIFQSCFNLEYLQSFKLLNSNSSIQEIIQFISNLINEKNIQIIDYQINLKFILISSLPDNNNIELILNQKEIFSKEVIEILIEEITDLKKENMIIKNSLKTEIEKLNNKIDLIEKENINKKKENELLKTEIKQNEIKIEEITSKIKILEKYHSNEKYINIKNKKSIKLHDNIINTISKFPSGNIISVSTDQSIKIYDINLNTIQHIKNAHENSITYVDVKNEDNFITCSCDKNIKTWIKKENKFELNKIIKNAHEDKIWKVLYYNDIIISCSDDKTIKIWEENIKSNNYQSLTVLKQKDKILSILLLEDKKKLVSGGVDGTCLYDLITYNLIYHFKETLCGSWNALCRIDEDKIIIKGKGVTSLKVISISQKKIIKEINHQFYCWGINYIKEKGIFLVGGNCKDFQIYNCDNYQCIQTIDANGYFILGFILLKNGNILSYGYDGIVNVWSF